MEYKKYVEMMIVVLITIWIATHVKAIAELVGLTPVVGAY